VISGWQEAYLDNSDWSLVRGVPIISPTLGSKGVDKGGDSTGGSVRGVGTGSAHAGDDDEGVGTAGASIGGEWHCPYSGHTFSSGNGHC
jgi:hypothetical protein